ncbi:MAG TPA: class I SAM-dependent methyltransferase [bacterium]|nr:class I SAM-dependent methyltransferase [bacterium]
MDSHEKKIIAKGLRIAESVMSEEDRIWSRYSSDKIDIGESLANVIRTLSKELPLGRPMTALSIGSSNEPQFRILETAFQRGLFLVDIEKEALDIVRERIARQWTGHVDTIRADYNKILSDVDRTRRFAKTGLRGRRVELVTLHHSLYYSSESDWPRYMENICRYLLAPVGAVHAVLMAATTRETGTTSWLYEHFAGRFCGHHNTQDLMAFGRAIARDPLYAGAVIRAKRSRVYFFVEDFEKFMAVVWMILLYPNVHRYTHEQREEIAHFMYATFWKKKKPLVQVQDHLAIYKGISGKGLI